jgi:LacI family transcriptional regulator
VYDKVGVSAEIRSVTVKKFAKYIANKYTSTCAQSQGFHLKERRSSDICHHHNRLQFHFTGVYNRQRNSYRYIMYSIRHAIVRDNPIKNHKRSAQNAPISIERLSNMPRKMPGPPRITIAEIARAVGVSPPTVSKVLNNRSDVAPETRARVEQVIAQSGYVVNRAAQALWKGRTGLIDLVVHDLTQDYNFAILRGVEEIVESTDMRLVLSATYGESNYERQWLSKLVHGSTDGALLLLADSKSQHLEELRRRGIPFVVVDHRGELGSDIPSVGSTNWTGAYQAVEYLIGLGHRRIAFIGGKPSFLSAQARLAGYRAALEAAGIPVIPEYVRPGRFQREDGYHETNKLLALPSAPTAIFAGNDTQALGAYQALREHGIAVPEQISVAGFDNAPLSAEVSPLLTTVNQPLNEMGKFATKMLLQLIEGKPLDSTRVELATSMVIRESCAPPPEEQ